SLVSSLQRSSGRPIPLASPWQLSSSSLQRVSWPTGRREQRFQPLLVRRRGLWPVDCAREHQDVAFNGIVCMVVWLRGDWMGVGEAVRDTEERASYIGVGAYKETFVVTGQTVTAQIDPRLVSYDRPEQVAHLLAEDLRWLIDHAALDLAV